MAPSTVTKRISALVRAYLAGEWFGESGTRLPVGPLFIHGTLAAVLCFLARAELPPYPYGVFALSIPLALTTLPLLGELAPLLRADPAADWIGSQPVAPAELRLARLACVAILLGGLALGSLLPAALLAPAEMGLAARVLLVAGGIAQTLVVAAVLLALQGLLGERADTPLVALQTLVFCGVIVGTVLGLRLLPQLAALTTPAGALLAYPPAWFAAPLRGGPLASPANLIALGALALAFAIFALAPFPPAPAARRTSSPLAVLLRPARRLATRVWVRRDERAVFDLVYDALPAERDFVMRTYPLVAIPLAFLLLGPRPGDARGEGLLALLLFTPAIYLPILLVHLPATATPAARWIVDTAPLAESSEREAAIKALAVRFLFPLYVALALVTWAQAGGELALRVAPPAAVAGLFSLRFAYPACVGAPPLSLSVQDLPSAFQDSFTGTLMLFAAVHTILAILVHATVGPLAGLAIAGAVAAVELLRGARRPAPEALNKTA